MYLMDAIAKTAAAVSEIKDPEPTLSIFPELRDRMAGAPRYLLDDRAINAAVELGLGRPKIILEALQHIQVPYPVMWVEWAESGRDRLRKLFGEEPIPGRPVPDRLGFLLECDEGGRKGVGTWVWSIKDIDIPAVAPISPYFDLDARIEQPPARVTGMLQGNLGRLWKDNPVQLASLYEIWETAKHEPSEWGYKYFAALYKLGDNMEDRLAHCMADVYGEYIEIWTILLLLTSSRPIINYRPIDRTKINKARAKKREAPLWDHTEVTMHINRHVANGSAARAPLGYTRKSPRVHMVSRYLARRGTKHWIVEPYVRGSGEAVERHVNVRG